MKVLGILAVLCILQVIAGQVTKEGQQVEQHNQGGQGQADKGQATQSNKDKQQAAAQSQHEAQNDDQQHAALQQNSNLNTQHSAAQSKVSEKIPTNTQQGAHQVSQQVPHVVAQHVANKQRMVRSVKNRHNWQDMQVNAVQQTGKCDFICDQPNVTACGYNGRCYWLFENQCELNTYNCLNTQKIFQVVDFAKCQVDGAPNCYRGDL